MHKIENIENLINEQGYTVINRDHLFVSRGIPCTDKDGYKFILKRDHLFRGSKPLYFHASNPYVLENINKYIELHNINTRLISDCYIRSNEKLKWKCMCGNEFDTSWSNFTLGKHTCGVCSNKFRHESLRLDQEYVCDVIHRRGYNLVNSFDDTGITLQKIDIIDSNGYMYYVWFPDFEKGKIPEKFHPSNRHTIFNINRFLNNTKRSDYVCVSKEYHNNTAPLQIIHLPCMTLFNASLTQLQGKLTGKTKYYKFQQQIK